MVYSVAIHTVEELVSTHSVHSYWYKDYTFCVNVAATASVTLESEYSVI